MTGLALVGLLAATAATAAPAGAAVADADGGGSHRVEYFLAPGGAGRTVEVPAAAPATTGRSAGASLGAADAAVDGTVGRQSVTGTTDDRLDVVITANSTKYGGAGYSAHAYPVCAPSQAGGIPHDPAI
ncbi:hypothetical protein [Streptomyces sp. NPDC005181]|uniref:hypothetical protein n=1 Tax=Streptomyces sp. NPDC005181 TaxID=3156869 RepID=UPI0033ABCA94